MGSNTPKIFLYKVDVDDAVNVDTDLNDNFRIIDDLIAFAVCTSDNRPDPYEGLKIYEEDTGLIYIYALGVWTPFVSTPPVSVSGGRKAFVKVTTSSAAIGTSEATTGLNATFTSQANRTYWVEVGFFVIGSTASMESLWYLRWAAGSSVTTAGTLINTDGLLVTDDQQADGVYRNFAYGIFEFVPDVAGDVTVGLFAKSALGGTTVTRYGDATAYVNRIIVRDIGVG